MGKGGGVFDPVGEKWPQLIRDAHGPFFQTWVQPPPPPVRPALHIRMDIQTDGDYIRRVVYGPSGDHML